jgi:hypothetical protein
LGAANAAHAQGATQVRGDFNNDGFEDLAVGAPGETINGAAGAGAVQIVYGTAAGLIAANTQFFHQGGAVGDTPEQGDGFGASLAVGDFNNDRFSDLAIGVASEDITIAGTTLPNAGRVHVLYGSPAGLTLVNAQIWDQNSDGIPGEVSDVTFFGQALAAGDFNGDTFADLAIGVPGEDYPAGNATRFNRGEVNVVYGSNIGLSFATRQEWNQDTPGIEDLGEQNDRYGAALAAGDFNGDGRDDLAIGIAEEDIVSVVNGVPVNVTDTGVVNVLFGSIAGLTANGNQFWHQDAIGIPGDNEAFDRFGTSLAAGDFNNDDADDLAIGIVFQDVAGIPQAGACS